MKGVDEQGVRAFFGLNEAEGGGGQPAQRRETVRHPRTGGVHEEFLVALLENFRVEVLDLKTDVVQNPAVMLDRLFPVSLEPPPEDLTVMRQGRVDAGRDL